MEIIADTTRAVRRTPDSVVRAVHLVPSQPSGIIVSCGLHAKGSSNTGLLAPSGFAPPDFAPRAPRERLGERWTTSSERFPCLLS